MATTPNLFDVWAEGAPVVPPRPGLGDLSVWSDGAPAGPHVPAAAALAYWAFAQRPPLASHGPLGLQRTG